MHNKCRTKLRCDLQTASPLAFQKAALRCPSVFVSLLIGMAMPIKYQDQIQCQRDTWSAGDFTAIGGMTVLVGELLCEDVDLRAGQRVLDVATGSGNTALSAARRWCNVTGIDFVPHLLDIARKRAALELLDVEFREGAAEDIQFPDESFDVVLSTFGCMFATDQQKAADELMRVCKPGGKIGLASWTPDSSFGEFSLLMANYVSPTTNAKTPVVWGLKEGIEQLFGDQISPLRINERTSFMRYPSAEQYLEHSKRYFGPLKKIYESLDEKKQGSLIESVMEWVSEYNNSGDETVLIPSKYLEFVATKVF